MFRIIRSLRDRGILAPAGFVLAFLIILSLIIILGQFFHQTLQDEMADQFNRQQLLLAQEIAINVEGFLDHVYKDISVISRLPDIERVARDARTRSVVEGIHFHIESDVLSTIRVVGRDGTILYDSASPGREGGNLAQTDYFRKARSLKKHERIVTDLLEQPAGKGDSKQFIVATPIYRWSSGKEYKAEFNGIVLAVLSMDGITQKFLAPVKSGARGYAWMMDSSGALLYHPTQPQMVGKNLYHTDQTCFQCHRSFDAEKLMIEGKAETFGYYEAPGGENKLAAYYKVPVGSRSWIFVVSAPYSEVIALMHKSRIFYSLLIVSIFITTLAASVISLVTYKKKIKAEEKAMHLENQRRLEQEIVISKNYLENIIENTRTNLMVLDRDLIVKTINSAQAKILGKDRGDILGKPFFSLFAEPLKPYNGIPIEALLHKTITGGRSFEVNEYRIAGIHPDPLYLDMIISPLLIAGEVTGIVVTSSNVTKRVLLEAALKKYTEDLEVRVDREVELHRKLAQQVIHSEKLAALGRLAAGVAHEIGNPLTSISTFAQLLREMATDEFSQTGLDTINKHIQRITDIVRQMSTFSRPAATDVKMLQVNDILQSSLDLMRLDKRMKNTIDLRTELDPDLPAIMADEGQIAQVFINIFLNALDAMPDGGVVTVRTRLQLNEQGLDMIAVSFSDTGTGIPADVMEKIFDPFFTTKESGKGTGLGLSVSYNIVKQFRGDIKVESEIGKGTTFTILLPVQTEPIKELQHATDEHPGR
ncbi:MAG: cache domain-containing protein [Nitrospiraceae bacterium]|nr:cache domain-containing protein [Nitrospiraceae bacterium]